MAAKIGQRVRREVAVNDAHARRVDLRQQRGQIIRRQVIKNRHVADTDQHIAVLIKHADIGTRVFGADIGMLE
ncbi:hypothetical protein SDC9_180842 [bioreactor metagenome]|uniref:Uncharacterized protein n=1 Tax=bioreactor metagenome TaxID=1076179 RepID=A0A645H4D9_9ZZZZ